MSRWADRDAATARAELERFTTCPLFAQLRARRPAGFAQISRRTPFLREWSPAPPADSLHGLLAGRSLVFVGDSTSEQQFHALYCDLAAYQATWWQQPPSFVMNKGRVCVPLSGDALVCFVDFRTAALTKTTPRAVARALRSALLPSDVVVFNFGVHYFHASDAADAAAEFASAFANESAPRLVWRETAPQHFPGGAYLGENSKRGRHCVPFDAPPPAVADAYNRAARPRLAGVPSLRVWAMSAERWDEHRGRAPGAADAPLDCTHWLLPGVPNAWNGMLAAMLATDGLRPLRHRRSLRSRWERLRTELIDLDGCLLQRPPPNATSADALCCSYECKAAPIGDARAARGGVMPTRPP